MPLTSAERDEVVARWVAKHHDELNETAHWNVADIRVAVNIVDDMFDANCSAFTQNQTIPQNLQARMVEPFKTKASLDQKWTLLAFTAGKRAGLL